jgi:iron complex transport system ATP-binding protein
VNTSLVVLRELSYSYRTLKRPVLKNLSLDLEEGKITAVLGSNGVGKTTLLHIILGWLTPSTGMVMLDGMPLRSYSQRERGRWMSLVPQREHIPFEYSMLEYVLLGRAPHLRPLESPREVDRDIGMEAMLRVGLRPSDKRPVTRFSGGELQLLKIARALTQQPRIMLLDEPTSHLDPSNKKMLVDIIKKQNATVLFTTHDPDVASACADNIVLMRDGRILGVGPAAEMLQQPLLSRTYDTHISVEEIHGRRVTLWF